MTAHTADPRIRKPRAVDTGANPPIRMSPSGAEAHPANLRSPSQSLRNPTTWFQLRILGVTGKTKRF
jgi:hypothetical protein